jgi:hypothetical protein
MNFKYFKNRNGSPKAAVCCYFRRLLRCSVSRSISGAVILVAGATTEEDRAKSRENHELHYFLLERF